MSLKFFKKEITMLLISYLLMNFFYFLMMINQSLMNLKFNLPFECGFNSNLKCQVKFPMNTLNFMMMFLFLDMEIILFIPFLKEWKNYMLNSSFMLIMLIILLTMKYEWKNMFIKWNL